MFKLISKTAIIMIIVSGCSSSKQRSLPSAKEKNKQNIEKSIDECIKSSSYAFEKCFSPKSIDWLGKDKGRLQRIIEKISMTFDPIEKKRKVLKDLYKNIVYKKYKNRENSFLHLTYLINMYTPSLYLLKDASLVFNNLSSKDQKKESNIIPMIAIYLSHAHFIEAEKLRREGITMDIQKIRRRIPNTFPLKEITSEKERKEKKLYYTLKDLNTIEIGHSDLGGRKIVMVSSADCGASTFLLNEMYKDQEMRAIFQKNILILSHPSGISFPIKENLEWNKSFPEMTHHYILSPESWEGLDLTSCPMFFKLDRNNKWMRLGYDKESKETMDKFFKEARKKKLNNIEVRSLFYKQKIKKILEDNKRQVL